MLRVRNLSLSFTVYSRSNFLGIGQVLQTSFSLIDPDTPEEAYTKPSLETPGETLELIFSDEFNVEGRSFYPGDDPFWEAVDLWYWPTADEEWYDPEQITTEGGHLKITIEERTVHNMSYVSGMMSTWNKFCFTGGLIEGTRIDHGICSYQCS